jgi:hypothetical protein
MTPRRYPPPWSIDELEECFVVKDQNGQQLAYVYFEDDPQRGTTAKMLTKDEARRIATNVCPINGPTTSLLHDVWGSSVAAHTQTECGAPGNAPPCRARGLSFKTIVVNIAKLPELLHTRD